MVFQKGHPGYGKGRPKRQEPIVATIRRIGAETEEIEVNGEKVKRTNQEIVVRNAWERAKKGEWKASEVLLNALLKQKDADKPPENPIKAIEKYESSKTVQGDKEQPPDPESA